MLRDTEFDQTVLEMIEHSPVGAVPNTPAYQDGLKRLYASHQAYPNADHKNGHVTVRSLAKLPNFHASNLDDLIAGKISPHELESNSAIFDRYLASLPGARRDAGEKCRMTVVGPLAHHRAKAHAPDAMHSLFLVPGTGPHPGIPGNYLYGFVVQAVAEPGPRAWALHLHDSDDGSSLFETDTLESALGKLMEVLQSAPFNMNELEALGFRST